MPCLLFMEQWAAIKKLYFKLVWRCYQLLSGFLANDHLSRVLRQSRLSANDKGDEMILGAVHRSLGSYLAAEKNSGKPQLGDCR